MKNKLKKLKKEGFKLSSIIFIGLMIFHALFLLIQKENLLSSFYLIPLTIIFLKKRLGFLVGLIPSLLILFNPFPIDKVTYAQGAIIKLIQAVIASDPATIGLALSHAFYPTLIIVFGVYNFLKSDKDEKK